LLFHVFVGVYFKAGANTYMIDIECHKVIFNDKFSFSVRIEMTFFPGFINSRFFNGVIVFWWFVSYLTGTLNKRHGTLFLRRNLEFSF